MDIQSSAPVASIPATEPQRKSSVLKKDLAIAVIIGFFVALLLLPVIQQSTIFQKLHFKFSYAFSLLVILPILSAIGMFVALLLAQKIKVIYQVAKFVLVGALNTLLDLGILSLLMFLTGMSTGVFYIIFKSISFVLAATNSYFWNKFWTFKKISAVMELGAQRKSTGKEVAQFFVVSVIGFALNVGVASLLVNVLGPRFGVAAGGPWGIVSALCGTLVGLAWNFLGYKLVVFKK